MPFDLASAKPETGGGFDLASAKPVAAAPSRPEPPRAPAQPEQSGWRTMLDVYKAPFDMAKSAVSGAVAAPIANVMGLAATVYDSGRDGAGPTGFRDEMRDKLTYKPNNRTLDSAMVVPGMVGKAVGEFGGAIKDFAKGGAPDNSLRGAVVNAAGEAVVQAPGFIGLKGVPAVNKLATKLGSEATVARSGAVNATRGELGQVESKLGAQQAGKITEAYSYEDVATRTQRDLDALRQRPGVPTQDVLGDVVRDDYLKVMADAKAARSKVVDPLYIEAEKAASIKEATGARVDVGPALKDIDDMLAQADNIPDLQAKLLKMRQSIQAVPDAVVKPPPVGKGAVTSKMAPPKVSPVANTALDYEQLDLASRYIKDIAFSGAAEGYGAVIRNAAKNLSLSLDQQISKFVPEHAVATAKWRELSTPMETLATRIGEALHDTEGGLKGKSYAKVSAQDLPGRIFGKNDRIEQLVDALSGGKPPAATAGADLAAYETKRVAAQAKVDTWVENWILDKNLGKSPVVTAPGERAALNAAPGAKQRLADTAAREGAKDAQVTELRAGSEAARSEVSIIRGSQAKVQESIFAGDAQMKAGDLKKALSEYESALRQEVSVADPERYKAAIALIKRASDLEKKSALAKKLATGLAVATAGTIGGASLMRAGIKIPGAL